MDTIKPNQRHLEDLNVRTWFLNILSPKSARFLKGMGRRQREASIAEIRDRAGGLSGRGWGSLLGRMLSEEVSSILKARKEESARRKRDRDSPGDGRALPPPQPENDGIEREYTILIKIVPTEGGPAVWTRVIIDSVGELSESQRNAIVSRMVDTRDLSADSQRKLRQGSSYVLVETQIVSIRTF